ncbi:MAG: hypothetical protein HUU38_04400 [Anaerolineales bacterium]|nr:hypothetical protein [Anaerolineales bacterium]
MVAGAVGAVGGLAAVGLGFWGTVGVGSLTGVVAGQYGRMTELALSGQWDQASTTLFRPGDMLLDAVSSGIASPAGYKIGQLAKNLKGLGQWGVPEEYFGDYFDDLVINPNHGIPRIGTNILNHPIGTDFSAGFDSATGAMDFMPQHPDFPPPAGYVNQSGGHAGPKNNLINSGSNLSALHGFAVKYGPGTNQLHIINFISGTLNRQHGSREASSAIQSIIIRALEVHGWNLVP